MIKDQKITGFILAGGKSSRMGEDKGLIQVNGKAMIQNPIQVLQDICDEVIIVSNNSTYRQFGLNVIEDEVKDQGPLAGICTALSYSTTQLNIIVTCDSPFVNKGLIQHLLIENEADVILPIYQERLFPLTGIYKKNALVELNKQLIAKNLKVREAIKPLHVKQIEITKESPFYSKNLFVNLNSKKDLQELNFRSDEGS